MILDSAEAFVGCLAHNRLPFVLRPKLPIYAMDLELLKESWVKVISREQKPSIQAMGNHFPSKKLPGF
jgi:hypothetical protein